MILPLNIFIPPTYHTKIKLWYPNKQTHWMLRSTVFALMYKWIWLDERLKRYSSLKQVGSDLQCSTPALLVLSCSVLLHCWFPGAYFSCTAGFQVHTSHALLAMEGLKDGWPLIKTVFHHKFHCMHKIIVFNWCIKHNPRLEVWKYETTYAHWCDHALALCQEWQWIPDAASSQSCHLSIAPSYTCRSQRCRSQCSDLKVVIRSTKNSWKMRNFLPVTAVK